MSKITPPPTILWPPPGLKTFYADPSVIVLFGTNTDFADALRAMGKFCLTLTDPPYGIGADRHRGSQANGWTDYHKSEGWDNETPDIATIQMFVEMSERAVIWGGNYFPLAPSMGWLVWDKGQREFSLADGELAWTTEQKALRIFEYSRSKAKQDGKVHPTQKPVALMEWCIQKVAPEAEIIFDPYGGSGTTARAAKNLGKKCIIIEREEHYAEIIARRMGQEMLAL